MGATYQHGILRAKTDAEAISDGVDVIRSCEDTYGNSGYSGSFAECDGVEVRTDLTGDYAAVHQRVCDHAAKKWGPAVLVPLTDREGYYMGAWCSE